MRNREVIQPIGQPRDNPHWSWTERIFERVYVKYNVADPRVHRVIKYLDARYQR